LFFGVAWKGSEDDSRSYMEEFDVPYEAALDADERVFRDYGVAHQPATILIGKDGALVHTNHGPIGEAALTRAIERYL
jgi:cytochrome oxidase Cu insertion factor (SCO1/SenC/PrrC family)